MALLAASACTLGDRRADDWGVESQNEQWRREQFRRQGADLPASRPAERPRAEDGNKGNAVWRGLKGVERWMRGVEDWFARHR